LYYETGIKTGDEIVVPYKNESIQKAKHDGPEGIHYLFSDIPNNIFLK